VEFNRNHYLLAGTVILLLGIQFRMVDTYVLNPRVSEYLLKMKGSVSLEEPRQSPLLSLWQAANAPIPKTTLQPPAWLGWAMMSVGTVLVLHSLAMKPPGA
jgi:hypothetical protein